MQDVTLWLGVLATAIGLAALIGGAVVVFRSRITVGTIEMLERNNKAQAEAIALLDREVKDLKARHAEEIADLKARAAATEVRATAAERENGRLAELLQGKADFESLRSVVKEQHEESRRSFAEQTELMHRDLQSILRAVLGSEEGEGVTT